MRSKRLVRGRKVWLLQHWRILEESGGLTLRSGILLICTRLTELEGILLQNSKLTHRQIAYRSGRDASSSLLTQTGMRTSTGICFSSEDGVLWQYQSHFPRESAIGSSTLKDLFYIAAPEASIKVILSRYRTKHRKSNQIN